MSGFGAKASRLHCAIMTDDTADINARLTAAGNKIPSAEVFLPGGRRYEIPGGLRIPNGVRLRGDGPDSTILHVPATTIAVGGILSFSGGAGEMYTAGKIQDLGIEFDQPDSTLREDMIRYVPAIYIEHKYNWEIRNVRLSRAWDGIKIRGAGGVGAGSGTGRITDVNIGQFNNGIDIDGPSDAIFIDRVETHWVCGNMTVNQRSAYGTGGWAMQIGRMDDLHLSNALFFKTGLRFYKSANGIPSGTLTGVTLDGITGTAWSLEAGAFSVIGGYTTLSSGTAGKLIEAIRDVVDYRFNSMRFTAAGVGQTGVNFAQTIGQNSRLSFSNAYWNTGSLNIPVFVVAGTRAQQLLIQGSRFQCSNNCAQFTAPRILVTNPAASINIANNMIQDCGGATKAVFADIATDIFGAITGNIGKGWALKTPPSLVNLKVAHNTFG